MSRMTVKTIAKGQIRVSVVKGVSLEEVLEKFIQRLILWKKNSSETDDSETSQRDKFKIFGLFFENSLALLTAIG